MESENMGSGISGISKFKGLKITASSNKLEFFFVDSEYPLAD